MFSLINGVILQLVYYFKNCLKNLRYCIVGNISASNVEIKQCIHYSYSTLRNS